MNKHLFTVHIRDNSRINLWSAYHTNAIERDGSWIKFTDSFKHEHCVDVLNVKIFTNLPNE
jgi:hypothetical protein